MGSTKTMHAMQAKSVRARRQVFLSYAPADRELARELAKRLENQGCQVWFADGRLYPGDNWSLAIGRALEESDAMVVLLSPDSARSEWVRREIEYAVSSRKYKGRLIPVLVRPTKDFPWILERFHMVRATKGAAGMSKQIVAALDR
jgi:hypothetical protein